MKTHIIDSGQIINWNNDNNNNKNDNFINDVV